jgi:hypothetical protein
MLEIIVKVTISLLALFLAATPLLWELRAPVFAAGAVTVHVAGRRVSLKAYPCRPNRVYVRLAVI